jgi:hypothetical protein
MEFDFSVKHIRNTVTFDSFLHCLCRRMLLIISKPLYRLATQEIDNGSKHNILDAP